MTDLPIKTLGGYTANPVVLINPTTGLPYSASGGGGGGSGSSDTTEATQLLVLAELQAIDNKTPALTGGAVPVTGALTDAQLRATPIPVEAGNIANKFREAFETYTPGQRWIETRATGDIVQVDGNAVAASYLTISLDPLSSGTETRLESIATWDMPFEMAVGLSLSQRTLGQEFSVEVVSTEAALPAPADLTITAIQQATTTLTVTTATAHNLRPGMRIGIRGCADSRMNYPALVVATTPSATQFTATAGPAGTIPSVTAGPFNSGFVFSRSSLSLAPNGTSMIFENATATNASFYVRSESGDALPSGTIAGNHSATVATTASVQAINAALTYAFQPTSEYRLSQFVDGMQWSDAAIDTLAASTNRYKRNQVVPDIAATYRLRVRATNNASLTRPIAQIVSATKTGTTTVTVVTDVPHGLTTADLINIVGTRDTTNFPALTVATAVASVVNATTFTVVWGSAVTATSFGGFVARVNGGQVIQGHSANPVQSIVRTSNVVTATFAAAPGYLIGDYVNLIGVRNNVDGATLGIDGAYRIRNIAGAVLELEPISTTPTGIDITSTNCGGGIIRRTCLRISFIRAMDFERERVEIMPRPTGDVSSATSVNVQNSPAVTVSSGTVTTVSTVTNVATLSGGAAAEDAATSSNPVVVGGVVRTAVTPTTLVAGDAVRDTHAGSGAKITKPYAVPEAAWNASLALTTTTPAAIQLAAGAGLKRHITALQAINTGTAVDLIILDGVTERWRLTLPQNVPVSIEFPTELVTTVNTALNANLSAAGTVRMNAQGYTSS